MAYPDKSSGDPTLDRREIDQFEALAAEWWDPNGKFKPLHRLSPARLTFVRDQLCRHFGRDPKQLDCLRGLEILDVGCGGGLLCEPLAKLGARVTGVDPARETIEAAKRHASSRDLDIDYRAVRVEDIVETGQQFDAVLILEVVEHVPDVGAFLAKCAGLLRQDGRMLISTINRTLKSYALAIVGAEYVLRWLPIGTHRWDRFVTVDEMTRALSAAGLELTNPTGLIYNPLRDDWWLGADTDVNYLAAATFSSAAPPSAP